MTISTRHTSRWTRRPPSLSATSARVSWTYLRCETVCLEAEYLDDETILRKLPNITPDERAKILERKQREQEERMAALPPALAANAKGAQEGDEDEEGDE